MREIYDHAHRLQERENGETVGAWRQLLKAEADRQGLALDDYLQVRFPNSELAASILKQVTELIRNSHGRS